MGLVLVTPPDGEPVVLTETIQHLRLDQDTDEGALVETLITAARQHVEDVTNRSLVKQSWRLTLDGFPRYRNLSTYIPLRIPRPPLISVDSIKYLDMGGVQQTLANTEYVVDTTDVMGRVLPGWLKIWPITRDTLNAVTIDFTAGYGDATAVPAALKQAILILVGGMYENRESMIVGTRLTVDDNPVIELLLWPYRVMEL